MSIEAHGKHLCYRFDRGRNVHVHLGLYGKFHLQKLPMLEPRGAVRWRVQGESHGFDLNGPNCCELISTASWEQIRSRLGPDPLRDDADVEFVSSRIRKSRAPIGSLLLNQAVISGVGNVYRSEVLFDQRIHPNRPGITLSQCEFDNLWHRIVELLRIGVKYNRIVVASPEDIGKPRSRMNRDERLLIYKKEFCCKCDRPIHTYELANRRIFACDHCQQ